MSEKRSKFRQVQDLLLNALTAILSVPKKFWSVCTNASVLEACPEGWSGNGGVISIGGWQTIIDGSNSGSQFGSAWVLGLRSRERTRHLNGDVNSFNQFHLFTRQMLTQRLAFDQF